MEKTKLVYRCACCDEEFNTEESCREHFRSDEHNMVAIPAWIRYVAKMYREGFNKTVEPCEKTLDNVATL